MASFGVAGAALMKAPRDDIFVRSFPPHFWTGDHCIRIPGQIIATRISSVSSASSSSGSRVGRPSVRLKISSLINHVKWIRLITSRMQMNAQLNKWTIALTNWHRGNSTGFNCFRLINSGGSIQRDGKRLSWWGRHVVFSLGGVSTSHPKDSSSSLCHPQKRRCACFN